MQDVNGYSHMNRPIKTYIRIGNVDKIEIVKGSITMRVPLYLDDLNAGTSIGDINTALGGKQNEIQIYNGSSHLNYEWTINEFEDSEDTYFERGTLDSALLFRIRLTTSVTNKLDNKANKQIRLDLYN